jgi:hypothetical protein
VSFSISENVPTEDFDSRENYVTFKKSQDFKDRQEHAVFSRQQDIIGLQRVKSRTSSYFQDSQEIPRLQR